MGRPVMLSNGSMMVGLNEFGLVHDFYYPYVGQDNLTNARNSRHLIGVWVDGKFSWLDDGSWDISIDFETDALISKVTAKQPTWNLSIEFSDFVDSQYTAFCRRLKVTNYSDTKHEVRVFFHQVFQISHRGRADTVLYVPEGNYLYDYKGRCALLISAMDGQHKFFDQFSVGNFGIEGKEGTYKDAEDGQLDGNLVEHGSVDSVIRCSLELDAGASEHIDYWVVASSSQYDAESIHKLLCQQGLHSRLDHTRAHWKDWLAIAQPNIELIDSAYQSITKKSLMLIKAHIDNGGGILASGDSSIFNYGRDYYCYVWPRDGALTMLTLMKFGYQQEAKRFFEFCIDTIHPNGYMMHKYQPDRSIGSTWHPLMHRHHPELAIQEDETALVVCALGYYFQNFDDQKFLEQAYANLIRPAANFMAHFIDARTNLPHASYDLWEERFGTHTFSVLVTERALGSAARLADKLGHQDSSAAWQKASERINSALPQLYNDELGSYRKSQFLNQQDELEYDDTIDISAIFGLLEFSQVDISDEKFQRSVQTVIQKLFNRSPAGGVVRYEHDNYFLTHKEYPGNPWMICTLWLGRYFIKSGEPDKAKELIDWVIGTASQSGTLAEQVDPVDKRQVGVSPLVWSHAELADTLLLFYKSA
jgi:GH15 family glucan-1,4-alpha-glucosidase